MFGGRAREPRATPRLTAEKLSFAYMTDEIFSLSVVFLFFFHFVWRRRSTVHCLREWRIGCFGRYGFYSASSSSFFFRRSFWLRIGALGRTDESAMMSDIFPFGRSRFDSVWGFDDLGLSCR